MFTRRFLPLRDAFTLGFDAANPIGHWDAAGDLEAWLWHSNAALVSVGLQ